MDRWTVGRTANRAKTDDFEILHVVAGQGVIRDSQWPDIQLRRGLTVLIPACVRKYLIGVRRPLTIIRSASGD